MDTIQLLALGMGASWASGLNLYATVCTLGFMSLSGQIDLPPDLQILANPLVLAAAAFMYIIEFFADKIPGVDSLWDALHTFIRIPAGAMLAAGTVGDMGQGMELAAMLLGGTIATGTHLGKSGSRVLINTSPEPVTNWTVSIGEDLAVIGGLWTALQHPWVFLILFILFVVLMIWLLPKIWSGIKIVFRKIRGIFSTKKDTNNEPPTPAP